MSQMKTTSPINVSWLTDPLKKKRNRAILFLNLSRPLGYEHNDQTLVTNDCSDCPLQCVCSSFTQGQSSSRGSEGQALLHAVQRSLQRSALHPIMISLKQLWAVPNAGSASRSKGTSAMWKLLWEPVVTFKHTYYYTVDFNSLLNINKRGMTAAAGMDFSAEASLRAAKPVNMNSMIEFHDCISTQSYKRCQDKNVYKMEPW